MLNRKNTIGGFTLIEILVALAINLLLFSALISLLVANTNHYRKTIYLNRLNQQLETALTIMANEIRRAGYWGNAKSDAGTHQNNNPFMTSSTDLSINGANNCILFTYDRNGDNSLPTISSTVDDERYGFRLNGQALQARAPGALFSCTAPASAWENVTDTQNFQITNLSFILTPKTMTTGPSTRGLLMRAVDISITGRLASDTSVTNTLTQHVRLLNDKFIP